MSSVAKLILKRAARTERWDYPDRGDYRMERFDREFRESLYSDRFREILRSQNQDADARTDEPRH